MQATEISSRIDNRPGASVNIANRVTYADPAVVKLKSIEQTSTERVGFSDFYERDHSF